MRPAVNLGPVLDLLREATGVDFRQYKPDTLQRRVARRMVLRRVGDVERYVDLLKRDTGELRSLYQDTLIGVTSFFRDPECFEALKDHVFPDLVKRRSRRGSIRVWVLGCSTGEEAYSIAIALAEFLESTGVQMPVQILGTDANAAAIERARSGCYSRTVAQHVSRQRLRRYFIERDGSYRVRKSIRDMCAFTRHDAMTEPPFSRIDLVTCRNLLIYLGAATQQHVLRNLHAALKPGGHLWLGASETVYSFRDRFDIQSEKYRLYRKNARKTVAPFDVADEPARVSKHAGMAVDRLEQERDGNGAFLLAVTERPEAAREEGQSAGRELRSACEQMREIYDDLESSRAELRSAYEELATIDEQVRRRKSGFGESGGEPTSLP